MVNVVTAGRFKGKRIKADCEGVFIPFGREHLDITPEIVDHIRMMSMTQNRSFLSGFLRGFFHFFILSFLKIDIKIPPTISDQWYLLFLLFYSPHSNDVNQLLFSV